MVVIDSAIKTLSIFYIAFFIILIDFDISGLKISTLKRDKK